MTREPLDVFPIWLLSAIVGAMAGLALEGGYRVGRWRHVRVKGEKETPVSAMVGSILALFAFLLGFTFGMAASRYETRRDTVLEEANAIGTTYLRTQLLPEPQRSESARLLREYVDLRAHGIESGNTDEALAHSERLHGLLWAEAVKAANTDRGPITGLYIQSLNQMIDLHAKRVHVGLRSRIPPSIWMGLYALAFLAMTAVGYQSGISATRRSPAMVVLVLAFAGVLGLIADLDRAHEGLIRVGQEAMIDLQKTMNTTKP